MCWLFFYFESEDIFKQGYDSFLLLSSVYVFKLRVLVNYCLNAFEMQMLHQALRDRCRGGRKQKHNAVLMQMVDMQLWGSSLSEFKVNPDMEGDPRLAFRTSLHVERQQLFTAVITGNRRSRVALV